MLGLNLKRAERPRLKREGDPHQRVNQTAYAQRGDREQNREDTSENRVEVQAVRYTGAHAADVAVARTVKFSRFPHRILPNPSSNLFTSVVGNPPPAVAVKRPIKRSGSKLSALLLFSGFLHLFNAKLLNTATAHALHLEAESVEGELVADMRHGVEH